MKTKALSDFDEAPKAVRAEQPVDGKSSTGLLAEQPAEDIDGQIIANYSKAIELGPELAEIGRYLFALLDKHKKATFKYVADCD